MSQFTIKPEDQPSLQQTGEVLSLDCKCSGCRELPSASADIADGILPQTNQPSRRSWSD